MAHTVADFELAVLCAFQYAGTSLADAQAQALKQQAEAYCAGVKASADNWRLCLELFANSPHDQAQFYALQTLQTLLASGAIADDAVAAQLRSELLAWLRTHAAAVDAASPFLKTKLAVVLTLLIKRDYPDRWPSAFTELMALLPTGASMVELFFRILTEINTEIVEFDASRTALEAQHNMRIKDAMRESACMAETFDAIYNVLVNADVSDVMTRLSASALDVLKRYIAWVDIALIVNDRFVPLLFQLLRTSRALRCAAANCVFEVVDKGMTPTKKLALLSQLRLLDVVRELPIQDDEEFAVEVAEIVNGMGLELIECIDAFRHEQQRALLVDASTMLGQLMPLVWELFAHETKNVSEEVFEVVNSVGTQIRAESEGPSPSGGDELFQPTAYLPQILHGIYRQIRYPEDHDDTDEAEFEEYRRSLFKIYVNITRKRPLETLGFLANLSIELPAQVQFVEPRAVEAFISLVHRYMEGIAATKAKKDLESPSSVLTGIVIRIHSNMIALATLPGVPPVPPTVLLAYYDLAQRYSRVLQNQSQLIPALLDMMFGLHGLTNPHARVRSRVCYLCLQLVKSIGQSIHPHVENILRALVPQLVVRPDEDEATLANDPTFIPYDDQVYLFELAGQVIASLVSAGEAMTIKYEYTKQVLEPLVAALNATLTALSNGSLEEEPAASHCGKLLNAIANVSKAFKTVNCMANQQELFTSVLNGTAFVLRTMPRHRSVRSKVVFALHRFVAILDSDHLLANVSEILEHLMFGCDATDVLEIVQLLDQLIIRYKVLLFPFFDPFTMPFVKHLCGLMPPRTLSAAASESETKDAAQLEREAVQKYLYLFLLHVTSHNLSGVFLSPRNVAQLENVLLLVLEACGDVADAATNRAGFTIAHELVSKWLLPQTPPQPLDGLTDEIKKSFTQVMVTRFVPTMFTIAQKPHFEVHDAQCAAVMKEIRTLHEVLLRALGDEFLCYLRDVCLPSLGCPPEIAVAYAQQVATGDDKVIMAAYKQLVSRMK